MQAEISRQASGRSKGWGLVDYASPADANNVRPSPALSAAISSNAALPCMLSCILVVYSQAIATLHNTEIQGRSIIVRLERAVERPAKVVASNGAPGAGRKQGGVGSIANSGRPESSSGLQVQAVAAAILHISVL